jgi:hypothetical protein
MVITSDYGSTGPITVNCMLLPFLDYPVQFAFTIKDDQGNIVFSEQGDQTYPDTMKIKPLLLDLGETYYISNSLETYWESGTGHGYIADNHIRLSTSEAPAPVAEPATLLLLGSALLGLAGFRKKQK